MADEQQTPDIEAEKQPPNFSERAHLWTKKHPLIALLLAAVAVFILVVAYWAIWANSSPAWTGFGAYDEEAAGPRAKTLWDWLGLLIVPLAVAVGAAVISYVQKRTDLDIAEKARREDRLIAAQAREKDREIAEQAREAERQIAIDRQRQATLETYYERMAELLLLEHGLRESAEGSEMRSIARARTITVVKSLDEPRNGQLFGFLKASRLMEKEAPVIDPAQIDFSGADLSMADLFEVNLQQANLSEANLSRANLSRANLSGAILGEANLSGAHLLRSNLLRAFLFRANLSRSILLEANLSVAFLSDANLSGANLYRANLNGAILSGVNLSEANLSGAILREAWNWTIDQFDMAKTLAGATMPDGVRLKSEYNDGPTYEEWKAQYLAGQGSGQTSEV
jgi:uncharacterized protein YjbI with pentapeptide repeats